MRVIIPAAGMGTRLLPLTKARPKGLISIAGKTILQRMLELLLKANVTEVICVTGHFSQLLETSLLALDRRPSISFVHNKNYETSNSIVSINLTREWWDESFCIIDSDVLTTYDVVKKLVQQHESCLLIDNSKPVHDIDMRVEIIKNKVMYLDKLLPDNRTAGEFFGLSFWTPEAAKVLATEVDNLLTKGLSNVWYEFAIRDAAKYIEISPIYTDSSQWVEIDTINDLRAVKTFFNLL